MVTLRLLKQLRRKHTPGSALYTSFKGRDDTGRGIYRVYAVRRGKLVNVTEDVATVTGVKCTFEGLHTVDTSLMLVRKFSAALYDGTRTGPAETRIVHHRI